MNFSTLEGAWASLHPSWHETNPVASLLFVQAARRVVGTPLNHREVFARIVASLASRQVPLREGLVDELRALLPEGFEPAAATPAARVVGLASLPGPSLFEESARALVVPLRAAAGPRWSVSRGLPFTEGALARAFERLLDDRRPVLHERFAWALDTPLDAVNLVGASMDVAALLAAVDAASGASLPCFRGACALVAPGDGDALVPVADAADKLRAFVREYGHGATLVLHADEALDASLRARFREVVTVRRWDDLRGWLDARGALEVLRAGRSIDRRELVHLDAEARGLLERDYDYVRAARLVSRALALGLADDVPFEAELQFRLRGVGALANQGRSREAADVAAATLRWAESLGPVATDDDLARCTTAWASQLFHLAEFDRVLALLGPLLAHIEAQPRALSAERRVAVFNTAARAAAMVASARGEAPLDWRGLFERALALQARSPLDASRTHNYVAAAALRCGQQGLARDALDASRRLAGDRNAYARCFLAACEASLARDGRWCDAALDARGVEAGVPAFPMASYHVAVARQRAWSAAERSARLLRAEVCLEALRGAQEPTTLEFLLDAVRRMRAATEARPDAALWARSSAGVRGFLAENEALARWVGDLAPREGEAPGWERAEELVARLPYF